MFKTLKDLISAATQAAPKVSVADAQKMIGEQDALVIDVREAAEVERSGKIAGALHIPRGMLEFRADKGSPYYEAGLRKDRLVILYCASGARSAMAAKRLQEMGFEKVYNLGGFGEWVSAGGAVEQVLDPGM